MVREPQQRPHDVIAEYVEPGRRVAEREPPPRPVAPQAGRGLLHRAVQHPGAAAVEGVDAIDLWPAPREAVPLQVEAGQELGADGHRMYRRAVVVQQTRDYRFAAAGPTADFVGGLQHGDLYAFGGQGDGGGEPVGAAAYH